jgi:hypothetical protein
MKKCSKCNEEKSFDNFCKQKRYKDGYQGHCKSCVNEKSKQYYQENKEKIKKFYNQHYKENKQYYKQYNQKSKERINKYLKQKRQTDSIFKFKSNVRSLISSSFKRGTNQFSKKAKTEQILGCTIEEFRSYIENKFVKDMSFENYGKWHLDHIIPISIANTEEEIIRLNHYTNFQPLWAEDNIKKSNTIVNNYCLINI